MSVLVVGSVALDSVRTQSEAHDNLLGGSASYASVAASFFGPVRMVGIVGEDFPAAYTDLFASRGIDTAGLQRARGRTFAWSGEYEANMNNRRTLSVALNVFETFRPDLPESWRDTEFVLLANIAPALQHHVLDQMRRPKFVVADTMDLWIDTTRDDLVRLLGRVDMLILNDGEARQLTGIDSLPRASTASGPSGPSGSPSKRASTAASSSATANSSPPAHTRSRKSRIPRAAATASLAAWSATSPPPERPTPPRSARPSSTAASSPPSTPSPSASGASSPSQNPTSMDASRRSKSSADSSSLSDFAKSDRLLESKTA